ncbi:MAG: hypothetical protein B6U69_00525, partial [Thermofilum sp. ex4484_15]
KARLEILKVHTRKMPLAEDVNLEEIAKMTEGYSGSDLAVIVREAGMMALRENINSTKIGMRHFLEALRRVKPSITQDMIRYYKMWGERAKSLREAKVSKLSYYV